jgi:hypothetical protein
LTDLPIFLYFIPVNSLPRIITFILLLLALSTLTGVAQTASALMSVETTAPCCPHEEESDETPFDLPDCNQDCHCSNCQGVEIFYRLLLLNPSHEALLQPSAPLTAFPPGHQQMIDYPPETA